MRSPRIKLCLMFILTFPIGSCEDAGEPAGAGPLPGNTPTNYDYRGFNSKGVLVVLGSVTLAKTDSVSLSGVWKLECIVPGEQVGPQTGKGTFTGSIGDGKAFLNLNPGWIDNNVFLVGTLDNERIEGTWTWSTFTGPTSQGTFEALSRMSKN